MAFLELKANQVKMGLKVLQVSQAPRERQGILESVVPRVLQAVTARLARLAKEAPMVRLALLEQRVFQALQVLVATQVFVVRVVHQVTRDWLDQTVLQVQMASQELMDPRVSQVCQGHLATLVPQDQREIQVHLASKVIQVLRAVLANKDLVAILVLQEHLDLPALLVRMVPMVLPATGDHLGPKGTLALWDCQGNLVDRVQMGSLAKLGKMAQLVLRELRGRMGEQETQVLQGRVCPGRRGLLDLPVHQATPQFLMQLTTSEVMSIRHRRSSRR